MSLKCEQCLNVFAHNDYIAKCVSCAKSFHPACTRIKTAQVLTKTKLKTWKCDSCHDDSGSVKSNDEEHSETTKTILDAIAAMKTEINNNTDSKVGEVVESINSLKQELSKLSDKCNELEQKHSAMEVQMKELERQNGELWNELGQLRDENIDRDQRARSANLEITGLPLTEGEDIYYCLERIAAALKVPYNRDDISIAHRLKLFSRKHAYPPIIVQFVSRSRREEWLTATKKKKQLNATEIVRTFTTSNIYINDHLTPHFKALLGRARRMRREKKLFFVGYSNGKVLIKPSEQSETVRVSHIEDLDRFDK